MMRLAGDKVNKKVERIGMIIEYLRDNEEAFNSMEKWQVLKALDNEYFECGMHNYITLQLYDELGILPDSLNPYKAFSKFVNETFDIKNKSVIEIGGGNIPRLAKRIASMQELGTITVYDPRLYIKDKLSNMKLIKRRFSSMNNVSSADLLIGLLPCGASSIIVKSAVRHNKDFMIVLCDSHNNLELFDQYNEDLDWPFSFIEDTRKIVDENNMGKLKVKYLKEIGNNYPIIYNDRG